MTEQYIYAVARIRALETSLLSNQAVEQLLACTDYGQCMQFLADKGWGDGEIPVSAEKMLEAEEGKIWKTIGELSVDMKNFDILYYPKLFHNLKAAIKETCSEDSGRHIFYDNVPITKEQILDIIRDKNFDKLPDNMRQAAQEAYETFLHTRDGQLCDIIIDRAALDAVHEAGRAADNSLIKEYAETTVAVADIKTAVRCAKTGKSYDFMIRAMAECDTIDIVQLARAALSGGDEIREYLMSTGYAEGAEALLESPSAFERWCDNRIIQAISSQKYNSFTIGPVMAYIIARQNEIKTVRIILSGKQNGLSDDSIRERIREMYV